MPELPEVEVTRLGISPHILNKKITHIAIHRPKLRWDIPQSLLQLKGLSFTKVTRRAKYLLLDSTAGTAIVHLGMSGTLRVLSQSAERKKHDHVEVFFEDGSCLRYNDPRRFGAWLWSELPPAAHPLLEKLGPEPLLDDFHADYLQQALAQRKKAIKLCLMDNHVVVGVGNIYANEALFLSGIHPKREARTLTKSEIERLVVQIKVILGKAIEQGGTTLKDFSQADGQPGYFTQQLWVYGRGNENCRQCGSILEEIKLGQRTTVFCSVCQPLAIEA